MKAAYPQGIRSHCAVMLIAGAVLLNPGKSASASNWNQYRGSNQDGISNDRIISAWDAATNRALWRISLGSVWSSISAGDGSV
jgi:hypothetical protein